MGLDTGSGMWSGRCSRLLDSLPIFPVGTQEHGGGWGGRVCVHVKNNGHSAYDDHEDLEGSGRVTQLETQPEQLPGWVQLWLSPHLVIKGRTPF